MATNFTNAQVVTACGQPQNHKIDAMGRNTMSVYTQLLDFDAIATSTGTAVAVDDTYQALNLAVGDIVLACGVKRITATTAAGTTADVGFTGVTADYFVDGLDMKTLTAPTCVNCMDGQVNLSAADTIDLKILGDSSAGGKCVVWALIIRI